MSKRRLGLLYAVTIAVFNCLYLTQPIQPFLAETYGVSPTRASLMVSLTLLPLGLAPFLYGFFVERLQPKRVLAWAAVLLALNQWFFVWVDRIDWMILSRLFQGLLFPAAMTALMTCISLESKEGEAGGNISRYVACTIVGGFSGRFFSGWFTEIYRWEFYFLFSGGLLLLAILPVAGWKGEVAGRRRVSGFGSLRLILAGKNNLRIYAFTFLGFFGFASIMNFIPFRIARLDEAIDSAKSGSVYLGYAAGVFATFLVGKAARRLTGLRGIILLGWTFFLTGALLFLIPFYPTMMLGMLVFCAAFFFLHSFFSRHLNQTNATDKGLVNGLYVGFYYSGGAAGSYLPGLVMEATGWHGLMAVLFAAIFVQLALALSAKP